MSVGEEPNGFKALREYDSPGNGGNGDGLIDLNDRIFDDLRLWVDSNHDGRSQPAELSELSYWDIVAIDLDYRASRSRDRHGNEFRYASVVYLRSGRTRRSADVFLKFWDPGDSPE